MPLYRFICSDCANTFWVPQHMTDEPYAICGKCNKFLRRALIDTPAIYKTAGFYTTDSRATRPAVSATTERVRLIPD
jgi:putative FmdB family regulatory protein